MYSVFIGGTIKWKTTLYLSPGFQFVNALLLSLLHPSFCYLIVSTTRMSANICRINCFCNLPVLMHAVKLVENIPKYIQDRIWELPVPYSEKQTRQNASLAALYTSRQQLNRNCQLFQKCWIRKYFSHSFFQCLASNSALNQQYKCLCIVCRIKVL